MTTREKWLLRMLTGIFVIQASVLIYAVGVCTALTPKQQISEVCPELGERFDLTFSTMIATTLALLTGSTLAVASSKSKPEPYKPPKPGRQ